MKKWEAIHVNTEEEQGPYDVTCSEDMDSKCTSIVVNLVTTMLTHYKEFPSLQNIFTVVTISYKSVAFNDLNTKQNTTLHCFMKLAEMPQIGSIWKRILL